MLIAVLNVQARSRVGSRFVHHFLAVLAANIPTGLENRNDKRTEIGWEPLMPPECRTA